MMQARRMIRMFHAAMWLAGVVLAAPAIGDDESAAEKPPKPQKTTGTVVTVADDAITVQPKAKKPKKAKEGEEAEVPEAPEAVTIAVDDNTKVRVDGKKATLADVQEGYAVNVIAHEGQPAIKIDALSPEGAAKKAEEAAKRKAEREAKKKEKEAEGEAAGE